MNRCAIGCLSLILMLFVTGEVHSQNLVSNGNFEQYSSCPFYVSQVHFATGWNRPTEGTSDYFNSCLGVPFSVSAPDNQFGIEQPRSGNGYAGFYAFYSFGPFATPPDTDHEYVTTLLSQPLQVGKSYDVEFFISLSEASRYGVHDIGLLFSMTNPARSDELAITYTPQVTHTSQTPLTNKSGWTKISGCFVADSSYQYLTIGNFNDGINTGYTDVGTATSGLHYAYYYVDDVRVVPVEKPGIIVLQQNCNEAMLSITNYDPGSKYIWSTGDTVQTIIVNTTGLYYCTLVSGECTVASDTLPVQISGNINLSLGEDFENDFCMISDVLLVPKTDSVAISSWNWSTGETTRQITVHEPGIYILTATDSLGCSARDSITIYEKCEGTFYVPNAFTPNGDGKNDFFTVYGNKIELIYFEIYNRWGERIFETNNISHPWNGKNVPEGLYIWRASYKLKNKSQKSFTKTGDIFLIY